MKELLDDRQIRESDVASSRQRANEGDLFIGSQHKLDHRGGIDSQSHSRAETPNLQQLHNIEENRQSNGDNNGEGNGQDEGGNQQSNPPRNERVYEKNKDYKDAFQTRARLVRTPPQK
jgi:hypothetical protein